MQASLFNEMEPDKAMIDLVRREVSELARHSDPERASWKAIKPAISKAATSLRATTGQTKSPVMLPEIAKLRGINRTEYFDRPGSPHGLLVPTVDGFLVRLPKDIGEHRNRTSMAHEIGHTFFYDLRRSPPTRLLSRPRSGPSYKEEDICKWFARELLMPRELIAIPGDGEPENQLDFLIELAKRFVVSPELAATRLLWDLGYFPLSVGMFSWFENRTNGKDNCRLWKYRGQRVKSLRKPESVFLQAVERVLKDGPPFDGLSDMADRNAEFASVNWKVTSNSEGHRVSVMLSFKRKVVSKMTDGSQ